MGALYSANRRIFGAEGSIPFNTKGLSYYSQRIAHTSKFPK